MKALTLLSMDLIVLNKKFWDMVWILNIVGAQSLKSKNFGKNKFCIVSAQ